MKFADGYWRMAEGVVAQYANAAYESLIDDDRITFHVPTRPVSSRRRTLNTPVITIRAWSPCHDVIGIRISHFEGERQTTPSFELHPDAVSDLDISVNEELAVLTSGALSAEFDLGEQWAIRFVAGGQVLTSTGRKSTGFVDTAAGEHYIHERLSLGIGEYVYGFGERFTAFVKNGQAVDIWNDDGGTASTYAYKNVPFYLTNQGYGVFVNSPDRVSFEVGSEWASRVQFSVPGQSLEYFIIYGPTPKEILAKYVALTGRPALPPRWSFGLWLSTSFVTSYDEETVREFVDAMSERGLPLSVFHFDCFWMRPFRWCDLEWDPSVFPDPEGMLRRLGERGVRTSVWINPYVAQQSTMFEEGQAGGFLLKRPNGDVWQCDVWQAGMALVDFTNPAACQWFSAKLDRLLEMGVDCFKTDFGERIPLDVSYFDGSDPARMHNYYSYLYNEVVFKVLEARRGKGDAILFARSATTGGQKFPIHWGGDPEPTYTGMAESLRGGLSLGLGGFGFWSHDIGGFEGEPPPALFKRWAAFGLLSSHSRLHGSTSYRVPWNYGEEAVDTVRFFARLRMRLMPYLLQVAEEAHAMGVPMMRPMMLEFPGDPACLPLDRQYMLGSDLLVAPVFTDGGEVSYYLPEGRWTNFLSGEVVIGPRWVTEQHGFFSLPLMVRPGAVIAVGSGEGGPEGDLRDGVTLELFGDAGGTREDRVVVAGTEVSPVAVFDVERDGGAVRVVSDTTGTWRVLLRGVTTEAVVLGADDWYVADLGLTVQARGSRSIEIRLGTPFV